jgi:hypothetical protein
MRIHAAGDRLIVKNVTDLNKEGDPLKVRAYAALDETLASLESLDSALLAVRGEAAQAALPAAKTAFARALKANKELEAAVLAVLGLEA